MWVCLAMLMILNYAIGYQSGKRNYYLRKREKNKGEVNELEAVEIPEEEGTETNEPNIPSEAIAESHPYHTSGSVDSLTDSSSSLPLSEISHESSSQDLDLPPNPTSEDDGGLGIIGDVIGIIGPEALGDSFPSLPEMDIPTSHEPGEGLGPRPNPTSEDTGGLGFFATLGNAIGNSIGSIGSTAVGQAVGDGC